MTQPRFRRAEKHEADAVLRLYGSVIGRPYCTWSEEYPGAFWVGKDLEADNLFVLEYGGEIVGAVSIVPENEMDEFDCWSGVTPAGEFSRVVVAPAYQGRGLARLLVEGVTAEMRKRGLRAARLSVIKENAPARKLYAGLGFGARGEADMYGHSYYLCEKLL